MAIYKYGSSQMRQKKGEIARGNYFDTATGFYDHNGNYWSGNRRDTIMGVYTNPVGTVGTKQVSLWDRAYGTDSAAIMNYIVNADGSTDYWGTTVQDALNAVKSEKKVYDRVIAQSKAKTHGYIKNLDTGEWKRFQFNPEDLHYDRGVEYADFVAPQMAYPSTMFVAGKTREFDVELFMYDRQIEPCGIIKDYMSFFGQFLTPEENVPDWHRPPQMLFAYGYFIRKCVLTNFDIKIDEMDESGTPTMSHFTLTLRQIGVI